MPNSELDRNLAIADAYGMNTSFTCNPKTFKKIIENENDNIIIYTDNKINYKGIHSVIVDNNVIDGKCIIKRGDEQEIWEIMI